MIKPKVSIIVPIYNAELYLNQCISTILNQTYTNIEVILIDDGSVDRSPIICDSFAEQDDRVIVLHKENGGVSSARNAGIKMCTGDLIVFVDSDDWLESGMIEHMVCTQETNEYDIVMAGIYEENIPLDKSTKLYYETKVYSSKKQIAAILPKIIKEGSINQLLSKMYKTRFIKDIQLNFNEDLNLAEDALFNYEAFFLAETFYITSRCLYHYALRQNDSLSKRFNPMKFDMLISVNNRLLELIQSNTVYHSAFSSAMHIRFKSIYSCVLDIFNKNCKLAYANKREYIRIILMKVDFKSFFHLEKRAYRLLALILSLKNITFIYIISAIVAWLRQLTYQIKLFGAKLAGRENR